MAEEQHQAAVETIDQTIESLVALVARTDPAELMTTVYWQKIAQLSGRSLRSSMEPADVDWDWTLHYLHNLVAAVPRGYDLSTIDASEAASQARDLVRQLMLCLLTEYLPSWDRLRHARLRGGKKPDDLLQLLAVVDWVHIRRSRFPRHDTFFLTAFLAPHDDALLRHFGIDSSAIIRTLERLVEIEQFSASLACARMLGIPVPGDRFMALPDVDRDRITRAYLQESDTDAFARKCRAAVGLDYFDLGALGDLPAELLEPLSWAPGAETKFLAPGKFRGWPLRLTPLHQRPLLKIDSRYLCWGGDALSTTLYRNLFEILVRREPNYAQPWNRRQNAATETFVAQWFEKMLPGCRAIHDYYIENWDPAGSATLQQDVLIIYDDVLLVIECKARNFAYQSPAIRFEVYEDSLRKQIVEPYEQSERVRNRLETRGELGILSKECVDGQEHFTEIVRLRRQDFRVIITCAVMLDSFPGPAARDETVRALIQDHGNSRFWPICVEDLYAYADLLKSPLLFLNFLEWRTHRPANQHVLAEEELDHLVRYFTSLRDPEAEIVTGQRITTVGGTAAVARIYQYEELGDEAPEGSPPPELLGAGLKQIIAFLDCSNRCGRVRFSNALLALPPASKARLEQGWLEGQHAISTFGQRNMFAIGRTFLVLNAPANDRYLDIEIRERGLLFLRMTGLQQITVMVLVFDRHRQLLDVQWQSLRVGDLL